MAAGACCHVYRIIAAKRARAVVTGGAIVSRPLMFLGLDRRHLIALLCIGTDGVTVGAIQPLRARVIAMTEDRLEDVSSRRRAAIR